MTRADKQLMKRINALLRRMDWIEERLWSDEPVLTGEQPVTGDRHSVSGDGRLVRISSNHRIAESSNVLRRRRSAGKSKRNKTKNQ